MPRQRRSPRGLLAQRLDHLFRTVHPPDRGPYTPKEVAEAINKTAGHRLISATYLYLLLTGERDNPTMRHMGAIAQFFGVPLAYFAPDLATGGDDVPAEVVQALKDDNVRDLALRAAGLSERSLRAVREMVESARVIEGLPPE